MLLNDLLHLRGGEPSVPDESEAELEEDDHVETPGCPGLLVEVGSAGDLGHLLQ